jgi:hypothetical protein
MADILLQVIVCFLSPIALPINKSLCLTRLDEPCIRCPEALFIKLAYHRKDPLEKCEGLSHVEITALLLGTDSELPSETVDDILASHYVRICPTSLGSIICCRFVGHLVE